MFHRRRKLATAAGVAAAGLMLATGLAVAAVSLPDQASDTAHDKVADVDDTTTTTAANTTTTTKADDDETVTNAVTTGTVNNEGQENRPTDTHGFVVSGVAHQEFESGRAHGEAVSTAAHDNDHSTTPTVSSASDDHDGQANADEHKSAEHGDSGEHEPDND